MTHHLPAMRGYAARKGLDPDDVATVVLDYFEPAMSAGPTCGACGVELVPRENSTTLAAELGQWWDHPPIPGGYMGMVGHTSSSLDPSPALLAHLAEQEAAARQDVLPLDT